ncbi:MULTISPECIES: glycosyltransferase family 25 protein [unclassified Pseudoalteromonas]|uniref:glycosyltransferase family 25 protein n=1 Tax=unclassified Pseudoalteromonas TaxID=194690 RepID=UPI000F648632|nr:MULTISPECIES: glycosyltransferase family 25 protein [unclassified Pseudoalteromonas]RRS08088.1 glycosyltransferase family 25 protein [Pseudoalteromonas sp. J010]RXF01899.1 glycosyltransferase family 25 protein [Pseudoalteromonas sp. PS5]
MTKPNIFLINLDSCTDRLKESTLQFDQFSLPFERISAVKGAELSEDVLNTSYCKLKNAKQYFRPLTLGEIGCYLSHIKVLSKIVELELPYAFIFEDDFQLHDDLAQIDQLIASLPFDWDMIKLFQSQKNKRTPIASFPLNKSLSLFMQNKVPAGTVAQLVSLKGAKKILSKSIPFGRPIDIDYQHFWEKDLSVFVMSPCPVSHGEKFASTIDRAPSVTGSKRYFWRKQLLQINKFIQNKFYRGLVLKRYQQHF